MFCFINEDKKLLAFTCNDEYVDQSRPIKPTELIIVKIFFCVRHSFSCVFVLYIIY